MTSWRRSPPARPRSRSEQTEVAGHTRPLPPLVLATTPPARGGDRGPNVSFLELFYDLVYVVVIGQAAHHLAEHVSLVGAVQFVAVFGLIWTAWVNGSLYLELHGREDGRTRAVVFVQMGILAVLAAFTADATGSTGRPFALTYHG